MSLISLDLSNFDTSNVTAKYKIPDFFSSGMNYMFYYCTSLISLNLFNFTIPKETIIENMFLDCINLSYINFGNAKIENEAIISELNKVTSQNLLIYINNETLAFLNSLNDTFNFFYEFFSYQQLDEILNSSSLIEDSTNIYDSNNSESILINNSYILNILNLTNTEEFLLTSNSLTELVNNNIIIKNKSQIINIIREDLINGKYNLNNNEVYYLEFKHINLIIEITNTEKEKNEKNNTKTVIDLGNCEYILKKEYNITNSSRLFIFKIDIHQVGFKIPIIEYEIYYPLNSNNLTKLDLTFCKSEKIQLLIPVSIEDDLEKYNSSSDYYNDICSTTTSKCGTDISIKDRREEFIYNNMTLCENNCKLIDYNYETEKAKCSCDIKINIPFLFDDIKINKYDLYKSFIDIKNIANIHLMKCYNTVLKVQSLKNNYGSYILLFIILIFFLCFILFYAKYYFLLKSQINDIIKDIIILQ